MTISELLESLKFNPEVMISDGAVISGQDVLGLIEQTTSELNLAEIPINASV